MVAVNVLRAETGHFFQHGLGVATVIKVCAVMKPDSIKRIHGAKIYVVRKAFATKGPQLLKQKWCGDDGGACIKGKAVLLVHISTAPWLVELFEYLDAVALNAQANGRSQAPKAAANHHRNRRGFRKRHSQGLR